ncbi:MAG TPA: RNA-directed DNA polymerase [Candidatus Acidoferrum sp.]|nr:RNA-directed DNA polymerase [Candidatus Acidoferrum sp.]
MPIRTAIDLVLRDVTYSNAMPDWFVPRQVDHSARKNAIEIRIDQYLGGTSPGKPFEVLIPRKRSGVKTRWLQPSANDQMILQACVSALAPKIDDSFDRKRVFSYRFEKDPNSLQLTEDQCSAWDDFKTETAAQAGTHIMLMDLEQSFASIDRERFLRFLKQFSTGIEVEILERLLTGFAPSEPGLPLVNDSLFFLGNAYFSVVDKLIAKHTKDFRRFVDDYYVFGASKADLESLYKAINKELQVENFKVNELKLNIISVEDYCDALSKARALVSKDNISLDETDAYGRVLKDVDPNVVLVSLAHTVKQPEKYLNDGIGRFQLASLRKLRDSSPNWSEHKLETSFADRVEVIQPGIQLLKTYTQDAKENWRSIWLLYVMKDLDPKAVKNNQLRRDLQQTLEGIQNSETVPQVVKLWAKVRPVAGPKSKFEELGDADYEEAGRRCCGG